MPENTQYQSEALGKIIARTWSDPAFAELLKSDPRAACTQEGIDIPEDVKLTIYFAEKGEAVLVIPAPPGENLSDEALEMMAGGKCAGTVGSLATFGCPGTAGTVGTRGSW